MVDMHPGVLPGKVHKLALFFSGTLCTLTT